MLFYSYNGYRIATPAPLTPLCWLSSIFDVWHIGHTRFECVPHKPYVLWDHIPFLNKWVFHKKCSALFSQLYPLYFMARKGIVNHNFLQMAVVMLALNRLLNCGLKIGYQKETSLDFGWHSHSSRWQSLASPVIMMGRPRTKGAAPAYYQVYCCHTGVYTAFQC